MAKTNGYVKLHRSLLDHDVWTSEPFTRGQAWVDLLMLANYSDGYVRARGQRLEVKRGQVGWSIVKLSERWKWSRGKTMRFLNELENDNQIEQQKNNISSLITIKNYELYQGDGQQIEQQIEQQTDSRRNTNNNNKNNNNNTLSLRGELSTGLIPCPDDFSPAEKTVAKCKRAGCRQHADDDIAKFVSHYRSKIGQPGSSLTPDGWQEKFFGWMVKQKSFDQQNREKSHAAHPQDTRSRAKRVSDTLDEIAKASIEREKAAGGTLDGGDF